MVGSNEGNASVGGWAINRNAGSPRANARNFYGIEVSLLKPRLSFLRSLFDWMSVRGFCLFLFFAFLRIFVNLGLNFFFSLPF